jgi:predicted nuclease of predicted toxin-antitoxin system
MNFLIDAHLPRRLSRLLAGHGHQTIHTLDFPHQNRTTDQELMRYADANDYVMITKDADFLNSFYLNSSPKKLWLISTGNITNQDLEQLVTRNLEVIVQALSSNKFIELNRTQMIIHV